MVELDKTNSDIEALERLASFLGTLFVKHEITETDEAVLAAAAKRRPQLKREWPPSTYNIPIYTNTTVVIRLRRVNTV